jgi:hypothetical protein
VGNLIEQLSSKNWQERIQAIDSMVEMTETRLPLFTSNMVKVKYEECFGSIFISTIPKVNLFSNRDPQSNPIPNPIGCLDPILAIAKLNV